MKTSRTVVKEDKEVDAYDRNAKSNAEEGGKAHGKKKASDVCADELYYCPAFKPSTKQGLALKPVSKRHTGSLDILVYEGIIAVYVDLCDSPTNIRDALFKAAAAVAENGHQNTVDEWIELDEVLTAAATHGHLNVVKFTVNHAREKNYTPVCAALYEPDALTQAILGQHDEMVEFLPQVAGEIEWDISKAYEAAASTDGKPLAEKLYGIYRYPGESGRAICLLSSHAEAGTMGCPGILNKTECGNWHLQVLKEALEVADEREVKLFVRKIICDLIFSGSAFVAVVT
ncbi:hypothetical protein L917_08640 [Phytophthora nicotianae]|uniref:Uncharacterized protein n=1 Tax=Phytophthora nicotianae TaxID=4792 RepID=W2L6U4_PHYNI|nr:hypothetical protein L917_08640 [Phytophthora nicotianae]